MAKHILSLLEDVRGNMIYEILFVTAVSFFRDTPVVYFPATRHGDSNFEYFKKVVDFHGIKKVVVGLCFFASLFVTPLLSSFPPWAIGPSLVTIWVMMMKVVKDINWGDMKEVIPAFVIIALMPLMYSISNGIIGGVGLYIVLNLYDWIFGLVKMRKMVARVHNKVSAGSDPTVEII